MTIKVTYNVTDVYVTQDVSPVYINVSYSGGGSGGAAVWGSITGTISDQTDLQSALDLKVPYTGATQDVSLGEYGINVGNLIYDTTPTGIPTDQGATYWDDQAETVALVMNGTIQKIGEDTFYHVKNSTGSTIAKGVAVRFAGTDGGSGKILIAPFLANGTYPSQYYMGITAEAITNGSDGKVYHFGKIRGVNTSAFADGDILYCSTSVAGGFQTTAPSAPNNIVVAAAVINAANNGTLMVRTTLGSNINSDEGVLINTPTANQGLFYDSGLWVNKSISTALGYTPANAATTLTINGVTYDLSTSRTWTISAGISGSGTSGQVTYWSGASAVTGSNNLFWDNTNSRLGIGIATPAVSLDVRRSGANELAYFSNTAVNAGMIIGTQTNIGYLTSISSTSALGFGINGSTTAIRIFTNSNVAINSASDLGVRFGVVGDTLLRGSGATSATTALTVQNSSSTNLLTVRNDGNVGIGTNAASGVLDVERNQDGNTLLFIRNTNATSNARVQLQMNLESNTNNFGVGVRSRGGSAYKFINAGDGFILKGTTTGTDTNLALLADNITGSIKFGAGGSSTAQFTIKANGTINMSSLPTSATGLVAGDLWNDSGTIKIV